MTPPTRQIRDAPTALAPGDRPGGTLALGALFAGLVALISIPVVF